MKLLCLGLLIAGLTPRNEVHAIEKITRPYQTARSAAMGGSQLTTGLYDENFFGNPARITANPGGKIQLLDLSLETNWETLSHLSSILRGGGSGGTADSLSMFSSTTGDNLHTRLQLLLTGVYFRSGRMSYGILLSVREQMDTKLRRSYQTNILSIVDVGPSLTVGRTFLPGDPLSVGATAHLGYRLATDKASSFLALMKSPTLIQGLMEGGEATWIDFDVGATYRLPLWIWRSTFTIAASVNRVLGGTWDTLPLKFGFSCPSGAVSCPPPRQARSYGLGAAIQRESLWAFTDWVAAVEMQQIGNHGKGSLWRLLHIGSEARWKPFLLRLGLFQGYLSGGVGMNFGILDLDFSTYGEELSLNIGGLQDRLWVLRLGWRI